MTSEIEYTVEGTVETPPVSRRGRPLAQMAQVLRALAATDGTTWLRVRTSLPASEQRSAGGRYRTLQRHGYEVKTRSEDGVVYLYVRKRNAGESMP